MSYKSTSSEFQFEAIFIIESLSEKGECIRKGTCFSISEELFLTAKHTLINGTKYHCYFTSEGGEGKSFIELEILEHKSEWDFSILRAVDKKVASYIPISDADVARSTRVKSCGFPIESGCVASPIDVLVNNHYPENIKHLYNFELTQSSTIKDYSGMSGSPVIYKDHAIGVLVVQRGSTILKVISISQIAKEIPDLIKELNFEVISGEEVNYDPPSHPDSPFYTKIDCNKGNPNIKGLDIGFDRSIWRADNLIRLSREWIIDYALSASAKKTTQNMPYSQMLKAMSIFKECDMNTMCDLFLHIAIRQNHKTVPIINKIFNTNKGSALSCSHIVIEKGNVEIWLGASAIKDNLQDATNEAINNINTLLSVKDLEDRLVVITQEMDQSWPFKDKLIKITDSTIPLFERFNKLIIPVFVTHDSQLIANYSEEKFEENLQEELDQCRQLLEQNFSNEIIKLADLRVFIFPSQDNSTLLNKFKEEISL